MPLDISFVTYAGPPAIGAFIGYLTNRIAIRMLFRPLKPWKVLGIRVPMTPGVIPSKRHQLAENIGDMVGEHLLTSREVGAAVSAEPFQSHMHALVDRRIEQVISLELGSLSMLIPDRFRSYFRVGVRTLKGRLHIRLREFLASEAFAIHLDKMVSEQIAALGERRVNELLDTERREALYGFLEQLVRDLLANPGTNRWLASYLEEQVTATAEKGKTLRDCLTEPLVDLARSLISSQAPHLLQRLALLLEDPVIRTKIISAVLEGVDKFLDSLGPMGAMAKGFFDRSMVESKVEEYLSSKKEDLQRWLESPAVQARMAQVLLDRTEHFLDTPLANFLERLGNERLTTVCGAAAEQLLALLQAKGTLKALSNLLRHHLEEVLGQGDRTVVAVAGDLLTQEDRIHLQQTLTSEVAAMLRSQAAAGATRKIINSMIDHVVTRPVGILKEIMPTGVRSGVSEYITLLANRMLLHEVPGLVESLNIRQMVADKVDSLDLLRLEALLLSIMEEQFKYINLFGALLGFLIGCGNLLLLQLS